VVTAHSFRTGLVASVCLTSLILILNFFATTPAQEVSAGEKRSLSLHLTDRLITCDLQEMHHAIHFLAA
jgi:hypothetical protein